MPKKVIKEDNNEWQTPQDLWESLNYHYNFTHDLAASSVNAKVEIFFSMENSFLETEEQSFSDEDVCWMNPPFSQAYEFFKKMNSLNLAGVCIYRCDNMESKTWQEQILPYADWIFIPKGRVRYVKLVEEVRSRSQVMFPSAIIGFGVSKPPLMPMVGRYLKVDGDQLRD